MNNSAKLTTLLFYSGEPVRIKDLTKTFGTNRNEIVSLIKYTNTHLSKLGLTIVSDETQAQLVLLSEYSELIEEFYQTSPQPLSQAALEVLSVVAYNQPINKDEIDEMRGVSSDQSIKNLINKGLIKKTKNANGVIMYKTTVSFLKTVGIKSLKELKSYNEASAQ